MNKKEQLIKELVQKAISNMQEELAGLTNESTITAHELREKHLVNALKEAMASQCDEIISEISTAKKGITKGPPYYYDEPYNEIIEEVEYMAKKLRECESK